METLSRILNSHLVRYPAMQVQDLYKLLHQAALGSEHAACAGPAAWDWLKRELNEMGDGPDDPLTDPISPQGQILRIHLRPYVSTGKPPQTLLQAFIRTADEWPGSLEKLKQYGAAAAQLAQPGTGSIRREEIEVYFVKMEKQDFPAVHHSDIYTRLYRPAYRVVARQFLEEK